MRAGETVVTATQPVSRELEVALRQKLGKGMQVWLDRDGTYTRFVDQLAEAADEGGFVPVVRYRGSFLRTMIDLRGVAETAQNTPVLVHLPGFVADELEGTPLLGYYKAGSRYQVNLATLVENAAAGKIDPDEIRTYLEANPTSLEDADVWLSKQLGQAGDGLSHLELHWLWERLREGAAELPSPEECRTHLRTVVSLDPAKTGHDALLRAGTEAEQRRTLADSLAAWCMAIEYVKDLEREPVDPDLAGLKPPELNKVYQEAALKLVDFVRHNFADEYLRIASDFELKIEEERRAGRAADLGKIDTFLFEDDRMMAESLEMLTNGESTQVGAWAAERTPKKSIWLREKRGRAAVWSLIRAAVQLNEVVATHDQALAGAVSLDEAAVLYRDHLWRVDRAHRDFEQKRRRYLQASLPHFAKLREMLDAVRGRYHGWAEQTARQFSKLCEKENRFIPAKSRQQRELFEQDVREHVKPTDRIAYMLLDGFRFEMARELLERLDDGTKLDTKLDARLAELPTITAVGMNVLAPVSEHGRLVPLLKEKGGGQSIAGFRNNNFNVTSPDNRRTAIYRRIGKDKCPLVSLDEVLEHKNLKSVLAGDGIAVVHSLDLDEAGEVGQGTAAFDNILMRIASAIRQLRDAGINRFVVTADHGFLLEPPTETIPTNGTVGARYHIAKHAQSNEEVVSVSMSDLAYDGADLHVVLPRGIRCFDKAGNRNYVHGGNSLQERVIPSLRLTYPRPQGGSDERYELACEKGSRPDPSANLLTFRLRRSQHTLSFQKDKFEVTLEPVEPGLELEVVSIGPSGEIVGESSIEAEVGTSYEVDFVIRGPSDGRTRIRVHAPARASQVDAVELPEFFTVVGTSIEPSSAAEPKGDWSAIADEGTRKVLQHIAEHGAITEGDVAQMLGGGRQARRFSLKLDELQNYLSFGIRVEVTPAGKRYEKE